MNWWHLYENVPGHPVIEREDGSVVCQAKTEDARLIAAAPELLEALELAVQMLDRGDGVLEYTGPIEWEDQLKAAIRKARGEA